MANDIMTALKMLKAKGGALDMKAAEIIEDLFAQVVAKRVGEKMADDKAGQPDDRIAVFARQAHQIAQLTKEVVDLNAVLDGMKQMIDTLSEAKEPTCRDDYEATRAALVKALEGIYEPPSSMKAHRLVDILAAEYRGALHEARALAGDRWTFAGDQWTDAQKAEMNSGVAGMWINETAPIPVQVLKTLLKPNA